MGKQRSVVGKTATTIHTDSHGAVCCTYHRTLVAKALTLATGTTVTLDSGGYRTATTKVRMNEFSRQFCEGAFGVFQARGQWYVNIGRWNDPNARTMLFEDGITFVVNAKKAPAECIPAGWDKV
jgi:hypothetical protein